MARAQAVENFRKSKTASVHPVCTEAGGPEQGARDKGGRNRSLAGVGTLRELPDGL